LLFIHNRETLLPFEELIKTQFILPIAFLKIGFLINGPGKHNDDKKSTIASRLKFCQER
jgi:hypothetical protein